MINDENNIGDPRAGDDIPPEEARRDPIPRHDDPDPRREAAPLASPIVALPPDAMRLLLKGFCNLTRYQTNKVIEEGHGSLPEFIHWAHEDVKT